MSIAVSALVQPSRTARLLLLAWSIAQWAAAGLVACAPRARFAGAPLLAALLAGAGLVLAAGVLRRPKTHRIDISGTGELRVTVQQDLCAPRRVRQAQGGAGGAAHEACPAAAPLTLLPGSVLWPGLMVLRLGGPDVRAHVVPVWRDGVEADAWRALAVALAVIGRPGRTEDGFDNNR